MRDERGAVMVMAAAYLTLFLLVTGLALDFGRAHLYRTMLQSAVDASALAGALEVIPMVELSVPRWEHEDYDCWDQAANKYATCSRWISTSPAVISGPEYDLLVRGEWWGQVQPQCSYPHRCNRRYQITREWIVMPPTTSDAARAAFGLNVKWPAGSFGARLGNVAVHTDPVKAEVTTTATLSTPTVFLKLIGIDTLEFTRTGSAQPVRR